MTIDQDLRPGAAIRSNRSVKIEERAHTPGWRKPYVAKLAAGDAIAVALAAVIAQALRFGELDSSVYETNVPYVFLPLVVFVPWVATLALCGVYERRGLGNGSEEYRRILNAAVRFLAGAAILSLLFKLSPARGMVVIALPLATLLTLTNHYLSRRWLHARRAVGACTQRVLVVGNEAQVAALVRHFRRAHYAGLSVVGACVPGPAETLDIDDIPVPVVGRPGAVLDALHRVQADTVAVADHDALSNGALRRLGWQLEGTGADLLVAPSVLEVAGPRISVHPVAGLPLLHVEEPKLDGLSRVVKQGIEKILAGVSLIILSPFLLAIVIGVRLSSPGKALFKQERVGQDARTFTLYKFRTMRVSAEAELDGLTTDSEGDGPLFKMRQDPRRTALGKRLRRFSLDELPQLWNIVAGHMSIVGPRPPLPSEVAGYDDEVRRRLLVKPGLTGLWQVSGRSDLAWDEAMRLDLYYVENWSPALDAVILVKTVMAVIRGRGAY